MDTVAVVIKALKKVHTEAVDIFHELYRRTADMRYIAETRRKCERQNHRTSLKGGVIETHYRVIIFVPCVERVLSEMEQESLTTTRRRHHRDLFCRNFQVKKAHKENFKTF